MSKDSILENYLNTINLGNGYYGVQAAARGYFNKDVSELSISECAVIASITKSPTGLNPIRHADRNKDRQSQVLLNMKEQEYISQEEYDELSADNDEYSLNDVIGKSGIEQVMDETLQGKKGSETVYVDSLGKVMETTERIEPQAGNDVYLSIDKDLQEAVYNLLEQEIAGILYSKIVNLSLIHISEPTRH